MWTVNLFFFSRVSGPPRILLEPPTQVVRPGENANIICTATGDGPMTIAWTAVDRPLPYSASSREGFLQFRTISVDDAGKYLCTAANDVGQAEAVAEVLVLGMYFFFFFEL